MRLVTPVQVVSLLITLTAASIRREPDGAFSSRDKNHYKDGGEHDPKFDHEAVLGSQKKVEEFEHLSSYEAKQRLLTLADMMDTNKDGTIVREELKRWVVKSLSMLNREEADEQFEEYDKNGDEFIDWNEYMGEEYGDQMETRNAKAPFDQDALEELSLMDQDKILFHAADFDHDEKLNEEEFSAFIFPDDDMDRISQAVLITTKDRFDKDKDGKINFDEFIGGRYKDHNYEWYNAEKTRFTEDLDKDKDGKLNDAEIISWMLPDQTDLATEEADHLLEKADDDKDGKLSMKEIETNHDVFVGSEVTNHGEHLTKIHMFSDEL